VLLQAMAEAPEEVLRPELSHLQAAEFLYETRLFPEHEYTFKHALTQQVAYETLLQEPAAGAACPHCRGPGGTRRGPVAEQVERLAHHALRGDMLKLIKQSERLLEKTRQKGGSA
jgi:hypothetical protein